MTASSPPLLAVEQLTMRFGGLTALNQVSFRVEPASITALIGPNGAGKTTLFNCVTGFYRAQSGSLHLHHPTGRIDLRQLLGGPWDMSHCRHPLALFQRLRDKMLGGSHRVARAGVARTFQNIRLFREMTVMENLLVAQHRRVNGNLLAGLVYSRAFRRAEEEAIVRAGEWLSFFGLTAECNRLAGELPYGHQRRLEIARALCIDPVLLCLDEPAAGLNPRETQELSGLLLRLRQERNLTILLIEHDMSLVMGISDHVVVLDHGEVIARGKPEAIRRDAKVLAAYLGTEAE